MQTYAPHPARRPNAALGFTLVELLLAMMLGLGLMAGVIQIFISTQNTYRMEEGLARIQDNGRFTLDLIIPQLRMAGYPYNLSQGMNPFAWNASTNIDANATPYARQPVNDDANGNDELVFQYVAETAQHRNCLGEQPGANILIQNRYYVDNNNTLRCMTNGGSDQPLVDNVESFQVLYGVDTSATLDGLPDTWVNAASVTAAQWQNRVVAVRLAVLINTGGNVADSLDTQQYQLLDASTLAAAQDLQRRRVFTSTVVLRNRKAEIFCRTATNCPTN